ncbi:MAG TPA: hypothetical protein VGM50_14640 [Gemmatimonadaceae bacterium]|jgi:hypothetical protein
MRVNLRVLAATAAIVSVAACSDTATEPHPAAGVSAASRAPTFDYSNVGSRAGFQTTDFVVSSSGGSYSIGGLFNVNFPANAVCDPDLSTYGDGEWNNACVVLAHDIQVHATLHLTGNGLAVDFQPELRFSPDAQVTVSTDIFAPVITGSRDYLSRYPTTLRPLAMFYETSLSANAVGDYAVDPDAITHIDLGSGRIWRRVKHFSGYVMGNGAACNPSPDQPDCIEVDQ